MDIIVEGKKATFTNKPKDEILRSKQTQYVKKFQTILKNKKEDLTLKTCS